MRRANYLVSLVIGAAATVIGWQGSAHASLITNGSFESGDLTGWTTGGNWEFSQVTFGGAYAYSGAQDGSYYLVLGSVTNPGTLSQTISDAAGQTLTLSYWLAGAGDSPSYFDVYWNGVLVPGSAETDYDSGAVFTNFQFNVVATGSDTLLFLERDDPALLALDNVSLTPVPEPGTLSLFGFGLLGLGGLWWRRATA